MTRKQALTSLLPWLYFTLAAIVMTWPLVTELSTSLIGSPGDNIYYVWLIEWAEQMFTGRQPLSLVVPTHHYPTGWSLAYTELTPANLLTALPFSLAGGPIFAYNLTLLVSFLLSGWIVYHWVRSLTGSLAAGLVAGTIFAFAPYRLAHQFGHLPLMGTQWLALHYYGLHRLLSGGESRKRNWLMTGLGLGLAGLSSMYYLYMGLIVSAFFVPAHWLFAGRRSLTLPAWWKSLLGSGLAGAPLFALALYPYLSLAVDGATNQHGIYESGIYGISLPEYLLPTVAHFAWGDWIGQFHFSPFWIEHYVFLGLVPLGLALFALLSRPDSRLAPYRWLVLPALAALVLSLGNTLQGLDGPVQFKNAPEWLYGRLLTSRGEIPLPNYALNRFLPFYSGMRAWSRYSVFVFLFLSVLSGIGFHRISRRWKPGAVLAALLVCTVLVGVEYRVKVEMMKLEPSPVAGWLQEQPGEGAVAYFPIEESFAPAQIYDSLFHDKPLFGAFYGAYLPADYYPLLGRLRSFPNERGVHILREHRVQYIVVDAQKLESWDEFQQKAAKFPLSPLTTFGSLHVYELRP